MGLITKEDLTIIVKGAIIMSQQDDKIDPQEKSLINRLITEGRLNHAEFKNFEAPLNEDITDLISRLSNELAKKIFILALYAVALADENFDESEKKLIDDLSDKLHIDKLKPDEYTSEFCEKKVLELLRLI